MAANDVHVVLNTCGITNVGIRNTIIQNEGFNTLEDIALMRSDTDVNEMAKCSAARTVADGRVTFGTAQIICLQGLVWWLRDCIKHGQPLDANDFDAAALENAMVRKVIEKESVEPTLRLQVITKQKRGV